jgi:hypothetical protein
MFTVLQSFCFKVNFGTQVMISQIWWIEPNVLHHHKMFYIEGPYEGLGTVLCVSKHGLLL